MNRKSCMLTLQVYACTFVHTTEVDCIIGSEFLVGDRITFRKYDQRATSNEFTVELE